MKKETPVEISTEHGEIVLNWKVSEGLTAGSVFIPYGLWINQVIGIDTKCTGTPQFKGIKATLKSAEGKKILTLTELVQKLRRGS